MADKEQTGERAARKARADAIRRARDERNETLNVPPSPASGTDQSTDRPGSGPESREPNYVDLIDREMRRPKKPVT